MKVVCAGMYRSGTTWQFNAVRVLFELAFGVDNVYSCFADDHKANDKAHQVIKVFKPDEQLAESSDFVLTTYRDEADIIDSMKRRAEFLAINPDSRFVRESRFELIEAFKSQCEFWESRRDYRMLFAEIDGHPYAIISNYIILFGIKNVKISDVLKQLDEQMVVPDTGYDPRTLLHAGHITKSK